MSQTVVDYAPARATTSKGLFWTGWVLSALPAALLLMGAVMNLSGSAQAAEGLKQFGYPADVMRPLGVVLLVVALLYLFPPTAALGAILITGWLGGAVATHLRAADPLIKVLTPAIFGTVVWLGLVLRDARLRAVLPFSK